jgi:hypothetical protein
LQNPAISMTLTQIKREAGKLPAKEQLDLADFLNKREKQSEALRFARIERRMKAMDRGRKYTQEQVMELHNALLKLGL